MAQFISVSGNKKPILNFFLLLLIAIATGCKHNDTPASPPVKAILTFPAQNSLCTSGTVISTTQSTIILTWGNAAYTDSYEVDIKNLLTGTTSVWNVTTNQLTTTLLRGTPYSWYVISKSSSVGSTAQSDTWKFYVAGLGVTSYSPFPATITTPAFGANVIAVTNTVNLAWSGADADNDIVGYDVYLGTTATPPLIKANVTDMFLNGVTVTKGASYYWKIVTKDSQGNASDSGVYQFSVN